MGDGAAEDLYEMVSYRRFMDLRRERKADGE